MYWFSPSLKKILDLPISTILWMNHFPLDNYHQNLLSYDLSCGYWCPSIEQLGPDFCFSEHQPGVVVGALGSTPYLKLLVCILAVWILQNVSLQKIPIAHPPQRVTEISRGGGSQRGKLRWGVKLKKKNLHGGEWGMNIFWNHKMPNRFSSSSPKQGRISTTLLTIIWQWSTWTIYCCAK